MEAFLIELLLAFVGVGGADKGIRDGEVSARGVELKIPKHFLFYGVFGRREGPGMVFALALDSYGGWRAAQFRKDCWIGG